MERSILKGRIEMLRIWLFIICAPLMLNAGSILGETTQTKTITFPADDGAHNELMEWWYWTGHLFDGQGNYYGFQKTYFLFKIGFIRGKLVNVAITDEKKAIHEFRHEKPCHLFPHIF